MKVLFGLTADDPSRVIEVFWEDEAGKILFRYRRSDGTTVDGKGEYRTLSETLRHVVSAYSPVYPAEVDDLRSAFKYLGKAADLVETLPEADLNDSQPTGAAS